MESEEGPLHTAENDLPHKTAYHASYTSNWTDFNKIGGVAPTDSNQPLMRWESVQQLSWTRQVLAAKTAHSAYVCNTDDVTLRQFVCNTDDVKLRQFQ
jgi:hypothetical protein